MPAGRWVAAAVLAAALLRLPGVLGLPDFLHADEAMVGVMAMDIAAGGGVPAFPPGLANEAGHVVDALLLVPLAAAGALTEPLVRAAPALLSLLLLPLLFLALARRSTPAEGAAAVFLLALSLPFLQASLLVNGNVATALAGWLGLHLFLEGACRDRPSAGLMGAGGALQGFACTLFDTALLFPAGSALFLLLTRHRTLWRHLPAVAAFLGGAAAGIAPLLLPRFLRGGWEAASSFYSGTLAADNLARLPGRALELAAHDLPALFGVDLYDFPPRLPPLSWAPFLLTVALAALALARAGAPGAGWRRCWREGRAWLPPRGGWGWVWLGFLLLYLLLYLLWPVEGREPRYLLPILPFLAALAGGGLLAAARGRLAAAVAGAALLAALQAPAAAGYLARSRVPDYGMAVPTSEVRSLVAFLDREGYRHLVAPYALKWRVMLASQGRVRVSSHLFGWDRERRVNREVMAALESGEAPLVMVVGKGFAGASQDYRFDGEGERFDLFAFLDQAEREGISHRQDAVGELLVLHRFTGRVTFPDWPLPGSPLGTERAGGGG